MLVPGFLATTLLALEGAEAEYEQIRGGAQNFLGPRGVKYLNTGLAVRFTSMKNSSDTIGNRTRDLPACSTVPQPTAPPRTPLHIRYQFLHVSAPGCHVQGI
jgi:hypothetical protein